MNTDTLVLYLCLKVIGTFRVRNALMFIPTQAVLYSGNIG